MSLLIEGNWGDILVGVVIGVFGRRVLKWLWSIKKVGL